MEFSVADLLTTLSIAGGAFFFAFLMYRSLRDKFDDRENGIFLAMSKRDEKVDELIEKHTTDINQNCKDIAVHDERINNHSKDIKRIDTGLKAVKKKVYSK